ncbi:tetratricopeptide repeat protein [Clostridium sp. BJN0001]|uniref:tetratricopeptide repeat protein n=1 Tax=Clostridium sp. BJN0001 TaxID=2930219 RepID=UPI001FD5A931|nr:tetratricopeptide repeat protein [Clostridium sp. BJN0001]
MNYFNEGNKYYNQKDYKRALYYYKKSIFKNQNEACSYYNSGVCFIKLQNYDDAIEFLKKAISLSREGKYIFNLGYCYAMKECIDKALRLFNLAWSIDSNDKECEKAVNILISKITTNSN